MNSVDLPTSLEIVDNTEPSLARNGSEGVETRKITRTVKFSLTKSDLSKKRAATNSPFVDDIVRS